MPKHGVRLMLIIVTFLAVAATARSYLVPDSFYRYGHFRADSVAEIAAAAPQYRGADYCRSCHADRHAEWSAGSHKVVKCEVCHGAAAEHPATAKLTVPTDTVRLCTLCHESMPARPAAQPQIEVSQHAGEQQCIICHSPHSPRIGGSAGAQASADTAAAAGLSARCAACHGADGRGIGQFPPLAGKSAEYLDEQLRDYRSGVRKNPMMAAIARSLTDQDIAELAAHFASPTAERAK